MMETISSFSNPKIKSIRKLLTLKERRETGLFLAEGIRIVKDAVDFDAVINALIVSPEILTSDVAIKIITECEKRKLPIYELSASIFEKISKKEGPQGIAAVVHQKWMELKEFEPKLGELWIGLEQISNPGNLGTIMRTCDAVGAKGIILLDNCTDPYDPISVKASMGAIFTLDIIKTKTSHFLNLIKNFSKQVIGSADSATITYNEINYPDPCILLLGSEREGLSPELIRICKQVVRIPMAGHCDSLNVSIAASIIMYQIYNQRK